MYSLFFKKCQVVYGYFICSSKCTVFHSEIKAWEGGRNKDSGEERRKEGMREEGRRLLYTAVI